jgi:hypothetical protein
MHIFINFTNFVSHILQVKITYMTLVQNFQVIMGKLNVECALVEIMHRNGWLNYVINYL